MLAVFLVFAAISALFIEVIVDCLDDHRKDALLKMAH
jgi:hypothetical protein